MSEQTVEPRRSIDASEQPVTATEAVGELAKFTWAKPGAVLAATTSVVTVFAVCVMFVHGIDRLLVNLLVTMSKNPLPSWVGTASLVPFIAAVALFAVQARHHHGASDPASMLTGATEDVIGRWPGVRTTVVAVTALLASSALLAWSLFS